MASRLRYTDLCYYRREAHLKVCIPQRGIERGLRYHKPALRIRNPHTEIFRKCNFCGAIDEVERCHDFQSASNPQQHEIPIEQRRRWGQAWRIAAVAQNGAARQGSTPGRAGI